MIASFVREMFLFNALYVLAVLVIMGIVDIFIRTDNDLFWYSVPIHVAVMLWQTMRGYYRWKSQYDE